MHTLPIGIFGTHMTRSTVHLFKTTLQREDLPHNKSGNHFISNAALDRLFARLTQRLTYFTGENSGFQLTPKYANHFYNVCITGKGTFTAGRIENLMVAMMFALRDLAFHEVKLINDKIKDAPRGSPWYGLEMVVDPWAEAARAYIVFLEFYLPARGLQTCETALPEIAMRADNLARTLLEVFPEKSGITYIFTCALHVYLSNFSFALTFVVMDLCRRTISLEFPEIPQHGQAPSSVHSHVRLT